MSGNGHPFRWELGLGRYLNWRCSPRPHRRAAIARPDQATTPSPSTIRPPPANQPGNSPMPAGRHATVTMRPPENDTDGQPKERIPVMMANTPATRPRKDIVLAVPPVGGSGGSQRVTGSTQVTDGPSAGGAPNRLWKQGRRYRHHRRWNEAARCQQRRTLPLGAPAATEPRGAL